MSRHLVHHPRRTALLGGSFNPAHGGHRRISLFAMQALGVDALWWLVSPGNPLKPRAGMAPLAARLASAKVQTRRSRIRATAIEGQLGTRYTIDTVRALIRRYPRRRFIWIIGGDNLVQLPQWRDWRGIARNIAIAVVARPGYEPRVRAVRAMGWLRRFVRPASQAENWTRWSLPAIVFLRFPLDDRSATAMRRADPDWHHQFRRRVVRDPVSRRRFSQDIGDVPVKEKI